MADTLASKSGGSGAFGRVQTRVDSGTGRGSKIVQVLRSYGYIKKEQNYMMLFVILFSSENYFCANPALLALKPLQNHF